MKISLKNYDETRSLTFDNKTYVLNEKDLGSAGVSLSTFNGSSQIGSMVISRVIGTRDISLIGYILGNSEADMLAKKRYLQSVVTPLQNFWLILGDYRIEVSPDNTVEYAVPYAENNKWLCKFNITGVAGNPCFILNKSYMRALAYTQGSFHFPLRCVKNTEPIRMGYRLPTQIKMVENAGAVDIGVKLKFKAIANGVENPYIQNLLTGETLKVNCILDAEDVLYVNTKFGEKEITYNDTDNYMYLLDLDSDWLELHTGENYLRYGADVNEEALEVSMEYLPQYLEV